MNKPSMIITDWSVSTLSNHSLLTTLVGQRGVAKMFLFSKSTLPGSNQSSMPTWLPFVKGRRWRGRKSCLGGNVKVAVHLQWFLRRARTLSTFPFSASTATQETSVIKKEMQERQIAYRWPVIALKFQINNLTYSFVYFSFYIIEQN